MKTVILILALTPWLLIGVVLHELARRRVRPYRDWLEYRALKAQHRHMVNLYGSLPPEVFVSVRNSALARLRNRGDEETRYGKLLRGILAEAMDAQLNKPDNV